MGTFRVEVQAVGGHGCQREIGDGGTVGGCGQSNCPDCLARNFVASLLAAGCSFQTPGAEPQPNVDGYAKLTHWPGQDGSVVDDLLTGVRTGGFGPKPAPTADAPAVTPEVPTASAPADSAPAAAEVGSGG